jgi:hypothetical protein
MANPLIYQKVFRDDFNGGAAAVASSVGRGRDALYNTALQIPAPGGLSHEVFEHETQRTADRGETAAQGEKPPDT